MFAQFTPLVGILAQSGGGTPAISYSLASLSNPAISYDPTAVTGTAIEQLTTQGNLMLIGGGSIVYEYTLTDGDLANMTYNNVAIGFTQNRNMQEWGENGTTFYTGNFAENIYQWDVTGTPYDISTSKTYNGAIQNLTAFDSDGRGYTYNSDGTKLFMLGVATGVLIELDVSPAYVGTATLNTSTALPNITPGGAGLDLSPDGKFLIWTNRAVDSVISYELTTAGTTADGMTLDATFDTTLAAPYSVKYSVDGHYIYVVDITADVVQQFDLNNNLPANDEVYAFPDAINGYFTTDFDMNGLTEMTFVVELSIDNDGEESTFFGSNDSADFYFRRHGGGNIWVTLIDAALNKSETSRAWTWDADYHVFAFKYDTTNGIEVFADGVSLGAAFDTDFTGFTTQQLMTIGRRFGNTGSQLDGKMATARIFNRALTDAEMLEVANDLDKPIEGQILRLRDNKTVSEWTGTQGNIATNKGAVTLESR